MTDTHPQTEPAAQAAPPQVMTIQQILEVLPHRFPFVMVDRVLARGEGVAHAIKQVSVNEPHFQGHFPQEPVMPGVLIVEALAQASMFCLPLAPGTIGYLAGVDGARFRRKVVPGDTLHLHVQLDFFRRGLGRTLCRAEVDGQLAAEAQILFAVGK